MAYIRDEEDSLLICIDGLKFERKLLDCLHNTAENISNTGWEIF